MIDLQSRTAVIKTESIESGIIKIETSDLFVSSSPGKRKKVHLNKSVLDAVGPTINRPIVITLFLDES